MTLVKKHRFWMLWAASLAVLSWYWLTDPDGGAETIARVQWLAWLLVVSGYYGATITEQTVADYQAYCDARTS